jgi:hypothetical protein
MNWKTLRAYPKTFGAGLLTAPKFDNRETFGQTKWHGQETGHSNVLG